MQSSNDCSHPMFGDLPARNSKKPAPAPSSGPYAGTSTEERGASGTFMEGPHSSTVGRPARPVTDRVDGVPSLARAVGRSPIPWPPTVRAGWEGRGGCPPPRSPNHMMRFADTRGLRGGRTCNVGQGGQNPPRSDDRGGWRPPGQGRSEEGLTRRDPSTGCDVTRGAGAERQRATLRGGVVRIPTGPRTLPARPRLAFYDLTPSVLTDLRGGERSPDGSSPSVRFTQGAKRTSRTHQAIRTRSRPPPDPAPRRPPARRSHDRPRSRAHRHRPCCG